MRTVKLVANADLLLHPVRLRIVQAFLGERALTTAELGAELDDVPTASLYRHVGLLADADVLAVVAERKVRGASERRYRLVLEAASVDDPASLSAEDHRRAFSTFVAALLGDFDRYLDRAGDRPDLAADGVGYRQAGLWLDDDEFTALLEELRSLVRARMTLPEREGRRRRMLSTVVMPGG